MYKLRRDGGDLSTGVSIEVTNYDGYSSQITVSDLSAAKRYRFGYIAVNAFGESLSSEFLNVAASTLPNPPTNIVIDWDQSTKTSLFVKWSEPAVKPSSPILGYLLHMDDGNGG